MTLETARRPAHPIARELPAAAPALTPAGLITVLLGAALAPIDLFIVNV